ncbi:MAG: hypothetical protein JRH20_18355 [Deltaproteobacteria bacterium]|nr:hypothetical protein [Deltaproteobacteria bacterium]
MFDDRPTPLTPLPRRETRTNHVRARLAELAALDPTRLAPAQRSLPGDLSLLERYVMGEVQGRLMAIECLQLSKRMARDFEAIETELLSADEISRRRDARGRGERRRHGRAEGYRWAQSKGLPPRIR